MTSNDSRRGFLLYSAGLALLGLFPGCSRPTGKQPVAIAWDRDTCEFCRMVISDRAYAAQAFAGSPGRYFKFDDIGCLVNWLHRTDWSLEQVNLWVADHRHREQVIWLDAKQAHYLPARTTPMDYGFGAASETSAGEVSFAEAGRQMLARDATR